MHSALCWCPAAMQRPGISSLLNVTSHLVSPVSPNISPRPTSNPVKMQSDVFHFCTTTLSCLNDQMLLLIMAGQDRQEQVYKYNCTNPPSFLSCHGDDNILGYDEDDDDNDDPPPVGTGVMMITTSSV